MLSAFLAESSGMDPNLPTKGIWVPAVAQTQVLCHKEEPATLRLGLWFLNASGWSSRELGR